ncbi:MAG: hypothetical protein JWP74_931 [Marmoricola sp.]|nr:hypothetical protein [Marmoricola sp.]
MTQVLLAPQRDRAGHDPRRLRRPLDDRRVRLAVAAVVLAVLVWQLGTGPFADGLRDTNLGAVLVALVVTAATTWCCALRWSLVSARFGEPVPLRTAYVAYYRSQLVNATLPGGVVGDVGRGVRHGLRPVLAERVLGQVVQVVLVGVLLLPSPGRWLGLVALLVLAAAAAARGGLLVLLSVGSTLGHLLIFLVAAESTGVPLPLATLVPIGALVLLGSAIPLNVAGWGPREGVAAWAFTAFGSTAALGLTVSVTFGVLATVATLPGLLVLRGRRA